MMNCRSQTESSMNFCRHWIVAGLTAVALATMTAQSFAEDALSGELVVIGFGGSYGDAMREIVIEPFAAETGVEVRYLDTCCASIPTAIESGQFAGDVAVGLDVGGLLNWSGRGYFMADERLVDLAKGAGVPDIYYHPAMVITNLYAYVVAAHGTDTPLPTNWAEFFDIESFPGTRVLMRTSPVATLEAALLADGVAPDALYPLDVNRALKKLDALRSETQVLFAESPADLVNMLATGTADYAIAYSNRMFAAAKDGLPVTFSYDQGLSTGNGHGILTGTRNPRAAVALLAFALRPDVLAAMAERTGLSPSTAAGVDAVRPEMRDLLPASEKSQASQIPLNTNYWGEHRSSVGDAWVQWLTR